MSPVSHLVLQASEFCNLDCTYCYLPSRLSTARLGHDRLARLVEYLANLSLVRDPLRVSWHLGEPLVAGVEYFARSMDTIRGVLGNSHNVEWDIQTNGTLVNDEWCRFFVANRVRIGVSLDGPRHANDVARQRRKGAGTFDSAVIGWQLLREYGLASHIISVLTHEVVRAPDAYLDFLREYGIRAVALNVPETEGAYRNPLFTDPNALTLYGKDLARFIRTLCRAVMRREPDVQVREIEWVLRTASTGESLVASRVPVSLLSLYASGDIGAFSPELLSLSSDLRHRYVIGRAEPWGAAIDWGHLRDVQEEIDDGIAQCRGECRHFEICGGGCPSNKAAENGSARSTVTEYCRLMYQLVPSIVLEEFMNVN